MSGPTPTQPVERQDPEPRSGMANVLRRLRAAAKAQLIVQRTGLPKGKYSVAFQSRLGRDPWLKPYTDHELPRLAAKGVKKLLVICPAFVSDCLETLEETQKRAIVMAYYDGLTHEQLAQRLASPLGTVKSWIRRGLQRLKGCLEP